MEWQDTPVYVLAKDRKSCLETLLSRLKRDGLRNLFIVDTGSTYPPMLDFLIAIDVPIIRVAPLEVHSPKFVLWDREIIKITKQEEKHFVYTDCDIVPDDGCPADWLKYLFALLRKYPQYSKAGLGLRLNDIPDCYAHKEHVIAHEHRFWTTGLEPHVFDSELDTTMALYLPGAGHTYRAIRTGGVYVARHLPWYSDSSNISEEERYYIDHLHPKASFWTRRYKKQNEIQHATSGRIDPGPESIERSASPEPA
jgi:hypothetical protein